MVVPGRVEIQTPVNGVIPNGASSTDAGIWRGSQQRRMSDLLALGTSYFTQGPSARW